MGADLAHRRGTEADLVISVWKMPIDRRKEQSPPDGRSHDGPHGHLVDRELSGTDSPGNRGDGSVVLKAAEKSGFWRPLGHVETELSRIAIQLGRGREMPNAGAEDQIGRASWTESG